MVITIGPNRVDLEIDQARDQKVESFFPFGGWQQGWETKKRFGWSIEISKVVSSEW